MLEGEGSSLTANDFQLPISYSQAPPLGTQVILNPFRRAVKFLLALNSFYDPKMFGLWQWPLIPTPGLSSMATSDIGAFQQAS